MIEVECRPDGLQFKKPVLVKLKLPAPLPPGTLVPVTIAHETIVGMVSRSGNELRFAVEHFSSYTITWDAIRDAIDSWNMRSDFTDVRSDPQSSQHFVAFWDFKPSAVLNGDPVFSFKGMADSDSRRAAFQYALRQAILQDRLPVTPTDQSAQAAIGSVQTFFDLLGKESTATDVARAAAKQPVIRLSASYQKVLEAYSRELSKGGMDVTLRAAHLRLLDHLKDIVDKAGLVSAAGNVVINIGKDVYTALYIRSLTEEVVDSRVEILRSNLRGNKDVPPEVTEWLEEVVKEIAQERADLWMSIGKQLQEGAVQETILPLAGLVNTVGPFLSAGWDKVASKFALPIGAAIETVKTLSKIDDFGWMIGQTTAAATLAYDYLPNAPSEATGVAPSEKAVAPEVLQMRAYLLYFCYDAYAQAYEGDLIDHAVRWFIGSLQSLAGLVPTWKERLAELRTQRDLCSEKYTAAAQMLEAPKTQIVGETQKPTKQAGGKIRLETKEISLGKLSSDVVIPQLIISADGRRVAYVARRGERYVVVVDGVEGKPYRLIKYVDVCFSSDSKRVAYAAWRDPMDVVVVDGVEGKPYHSIGQESLCFSRDGKRLAYVGWENNDRDLVIVDGVEGKFYGIKWGSLQFSPDSKRVAYVAGKGVVVDDVVGKRYDAIHGLQFSPNS